MDTPPGDTLQRMDTPPGDTLQQRPPGGPLGSWLSRRLSPAGRVPRCPQHSAVQTWKPASRGPIEAGASQHARAREEMKTDGRGHAKRCEFTSPRLPRWVAATGCVVPLLHG